MYELIIKHSIAFLYLLSGSISDIKTREVSDWSNYGLICIGFASNLIFSIVNDNWRYSLNSLMGFGTFFLLSILFFYTGQWGGGDAKLLMGLGALYGLGLTWTSNEFIASFLLNTLIAGALFGIFWSIVAGLRNFKKFKKSYTKIASKKIVKKIRIISIITASLAILSLIIFGVNTFTLTFFSLMLVIIFTFYLWLFIKAVESSCMLKYMEPKLLTEGDWIAKEVKVDGKVIVGPKSLGVEKKQITLLKRLYKQKKIKKVLVKEGIPFVPSFFIGWVLTITIGNLIYLVI